FCIPHSALGSGPAVEGLGRLRFRDDHDALLRHHEAAPPVVVQIVTDGGILRNPHVLVHDHAAEPAVPADVDALEQDRIFDVGKTVHAHVRRQDAAANVAAADDAALADHAVVGLAAAGVL